MSSLMGALQLLRPRTIAGISKTATEAAERTKEIKATLKTLSSDTSQSLESLSQQVREMHQDLQRRMDALTIKESQLRAVMRRDLEQAGLSDDLQRRMQDVDAIDRHVQQAVARAEMHLEPFPYAVVDDVLPSWLFEALLAGLPPTELYADRAVNKQQLTVPFALAPRYGHLAWRFMTEVVGHRILQPAIMQRFTTPLRAFLRDSFPAADPQVVGDLPVHCSDGRIIYRTRGYYIKPHRDPKWGMITGILYLAKPGDDPRWGTDLFTVDGDTKATSLAPHWIKEEQCHHVRLIENKPNRLLVFLNSKGAHGAKIPPELVDVEVERSIYQFRLTPATKVMQALIASLPEDEQRTWRGKTSDY